MVGTARAVVWRRAAVGSLAGAAVVISALAWAKGAPPSVRHGSEAPSEHARLLRLADGAAGYAAVESSDRVTVWWRAAGASGWSEPVVIEGGHGRYLYDTKVRVAGETVAIRASYGSVPRGEDDGWPGTRSSTFAACLKGVCTVSDAVERVEEPQCRRGSCRLSRPDRATGTQVPELSAAGEQAFFAATEKGYVIWSRRHGMRLLRPSGLPRTGTVGAPMLATDGSVRVVVGRRGSVSRDDGMTEDVCHLTLFTSPDVAASPDELVFARRVSTTAPTSTGDCATTLEAFSAKHLLIHTDQPTPSYLVRAAGSWRPTSQDPTGMVRVPQRAGRHLAGSIVRTGFWHWREVLIGSPDGQSLVAQVHFPGTPRWTAPITIARIPRGWDCFEIAPTPELADPFYVSARCRARSVNGVRAYVGVHAVTEDGRTWRSVIGDQLPTRTGKALFFGGTPAHQWTPEEGLSRIGPPVPARSRTFLLPDRTMVLITAEPVGSRCRLTARVADPGERRWSEPLPGPRQYVPPDEPCDAVGQADGDTVGLYFPSTPGDWRPARVAQVDGQWRVSAPRRTG